jgi:hypothetical protein
MSGGHNTLDGFRVAVDFGQVESAGGQQYQSQRISWFRQNVFGKPLDAR